MRTRGLFTSYAMVVLAISLTAMFAGEQAWGAGCGCMDVALIVDDSGSMGGAIDNVKNELPDVIATAIAASGNDLRMGLVSFPGIGLASDGILVRQPFTTDLTAMENAVQALAASGGAGEPESSDVALQYVVTGTTDPSSCVISNAPFGTFRSTCVKVAVLITDAHPGECSDTFTPGVSDVYAHNVAVQAANAGVLVSAIYVPTGGEDPSIKAIMEDYADTTGGTFLETEATGIGTAEGISDVVASCGGVGTTECITRDSRFWFTHPYTTDSASTNCATILNALIFNGGGVNLGFIRLPVTYENSDNVLDANDAMMEALGFYYLSITKTGENGNRQSEKLKGSELCRARKQLAVELIAATANVRLLGTSPQNCTYTVNGTVTNFPPNLLQLARAAAAGVDPAACENMTALLQLFNSSGANNNFPGDLVECSPIKKKQAKLAARDPTTQISCPGLNINCGTAEAITFPTSANPTKKPKFKKSVNLSNYPNQQAWWQVAPPTAASNRFFTVKTQGSNFDVILRIFNGICSVTTTNGITTVDDSGLTVVTTAIAGTNLSTQVQFATDGTEPFFIEAVPGLTAIPGKLKLTVTSP